MRGTRTLAAVTLFWTVPLLINCNRREQEYREREEYRPAPTAAVAPAPVDTGPAWVSTDIAELTAAYDKNEVAADLKYKGKMLLVRGKVKSIDKDLFDNIIVRFFTPKRGILSASATLQPASAAAAAELTKGQEIYVLCVGKGQLMGTPHLDECLIQ